MTPAERQAALALANRIADIEKGVRDLQRTSSLSNSSLEGGSILAYADLVDEEDPALTMVIGQQFDGANMAATVTGPPPPAPSAPTVTSREGGGLLVHWDGLFAGGAIVPTDFTRVEVHAFEVDETPGPGPWFTPITADTLRNTIETPRGTDAIVGGMSGITYAIALVTRTLSGAASASSVQVTGVAAGVVSQEALDSITETVNAALDAAEAAQNAAENALAEATLGGLRIFWADDPPTPTPPLDADSRAIWFDTNNGNKISDWSGTAWTPRTFGTGAIADGAVTGPKVDAFALDATKFNTTQHVIY